MLKEKRPILFIALVMSLILIVSSCQASVKTISVGNMILDIPSDWQKQQKEETIDVADDLAPYWCMDVYSPGTVGNEIYSLSVICEDIEGYHNSFGSPHSYEPNSDVYWGYLKDEYTISSFAIVFPYLDIAQQQSVENPVNLTIDNYDAREIQCKFTIEDVSYVANVVTIFSENDLGMLSLVRPEAPEHYKDQYDWGLIRDSVRFK